MKFWSLLIGVPSCTDAPIIHLHWYHPLAPATFTRTRHSHSRPPTPTNTVSRYKFFLAYNRVLRMYDDELLKVFRRCKELGALPQVCTRVFGCVACLFECVRACVHACMCWAAGGRGRHSYVIKHMSTVRGCRLRPRPRPRPTCTGGAASRSMHTHADMYREHWHATRCTCANQPHPHTHLARRPTLPPLTDPPRSLIPLPPRLTSGARREWRHGG